MYVVVDERQNRWPDIIQRILLPVSTQITKERERVEKDIQCFNIVHHLTKSKRLAKTEKL